jgi:hypothetical protein
MLTPLRFRDSDDPLTRELLASAEQDRAPSVSRARVAQGLGLGALASNTPPAPPGAARGMPSGVLRLRLAALQKYLLVGLATGVAIIAGWRLTAPARSEALEPLPPLSASPASVENPHAPLPSTAALPPAAVELAAVELPGTQSTPVAPHSEASRVTRLRTPAPANAVTPTRRQPPTRVPAQRSAEARVGAVVPARALPQSDTLLAEVAQLDRARAALRDQHAAQALGELDAYVATFPNAELALEAEVLRVQALLAAGEPSAAAALAERLLERPGSEQYRAELRRAIAVTRQQRTGQGRN